MIDILKAIKAERYNDGWTKTVKSLDKRQNNGYSIVGTFITVNPGLNNLPDGLYLDKDISGSRKNPENNYTLFSVSGDELTVIKKVENGGADWALHFWESIETQLSVSTPKNELAKFSDAELIAEIKRRGL